METAIAIPRPISEAAEQLARRLGMSLGELYTTAIAAYIATYPSGDITVTLNQVYATESSALDPVLVKIQSASLGGETW